MLTKEKDLMIEARNKYLTSGLSLLHPITVERGSNAIVYDNEGKKYIDFTSGIGVVNLGHCNPELIQVAEEQLRRLWHICIMVANYEPYVKLAEELTKITPGRFEKQAIFLNSGAEAVENAIKIVRQYSKRPYILSFENSFHGRTYLAMTTTGKYMPYKIEFEPLNVGIELLPYPYCYRCPFKLDYPKCDLWCIEYIKKYFFHTRVAPGRIAAVLIEPIQGEGGFIVPPPEYFKELRELTAKENILLIVDEIQTGFGRTGKMFAIENWDVEPDIIVVGKGIANGLPLSGVIGKKEVMDKIAKGSVGGTYGGNPVACSVALKVIEILRREGFLEKVGKLGKLMFDRLCELKERFEVIGDVRGKGMMLAVELVKDGKTKEPAVDEVEKLINKARKMGLLLLKAGLYGNVIRFHPPLTIEEEVLVKGLDVFEDALKSL